MARHAARRAAAIVAFDNLTDVRRSQRPPGAWFYNYPLSPPDRRLGIPRRALGLDADGTMRFIDMAAGSLPDGMDQSAAERRNSGWPVGSKYTASVSYDELVWWEALDLVRLTGQIAESCGYSGSWLLGAELGRMRGRCSSA